MSEREFVNSEAEIADGVQRIADGLAFLPALIQALGERPGPNLPNSNPWADAAVLDSIANLMHGTEWNADTTVAIADLIGTVRPHPGVDPNEARLPDGKAIAEVDVDVLEMAMAPYQLAHFRGDHWDCPPAECVRAESWRREMREARSTHDQTPVPSLTNVLDRFVDSVLSAEDRDVVQAALSEREQIIARHLLGAAAVRGEELRASTLAVMIDAGMEVPDV